MRKIIVYVATSADGYIARPDGDVKWLDRPTPKGNYGMAAFYNSVDTVLMGRKTYDVMLNFGQDSYPGKHNYVFSRTMDQRERGSVQIVHQSIADFAKSLRRRKGKDIWLVGGAGLTASFLDEGQIDEFIIHTVPIFIGEGIPLIDPRHRSISLKLLSSRSYTDGVVRLRYQVLPVKAAERKRKSSAPKRRRLKD